MSLMKPNFTRNLTTLFAPKGKSSGTITPSIPASLRQLLYPGDQPAYYTEEEWSDHSHLLKDYSSGVGSLRPKRLGYCYDFDGVDDTVVLPISEASLNVSFAAWIKLDSIAASITVLQYQGRWTGFDGGLWVAVLTSGKVVAYGVNNGSNVINVQSTASLAINTWYHIAVIK